MPFRIRLCYLFFSVAFGTRVAAAETPNPQNPVVARTQFPIPNPCNLCHAGNHTGWALDQLRTWQTGVAPSQDSNAG